MNELINRALKCIEHYSITKETFMYNNESRYIYNGRDKEKFDDRIKSASELINELFTRHSRLLFIRIDLDYHKELNQTTTLDQAIADIRHLYENLDENSELSKGYLGLVRKLEWTPQKGMHHHCLLIYDYDVKRGDIYISQSLGTYWINTVTRGRGTYHNCNMNTYENYAIGRIDRKDDEKRVSLMEEVIMYLAKVEQEPENAKGRKLFDMSRL